MSHASRQVLVSMLVAEDDFERTWRFARDVAAVATCQNQQELDELGNTLRYIPVMELACDNREHA